MRLAVPALLLLLSSGCLLHPEVEIEPLSVMPNEISRGANLQDMLDIGDYVRAAEHAVNVESKDRRDVKELIVLGECELAAGRLDAARRHLRAALDEKPGALTARVTWDLSQVEYLAKNFAASLEWAQNAHDRGLRVKQWHLDFLEALSTVRVNEIADRSIAATVPLAFGKPDIPRVEVGLNGATRTQAIIDTGAVLSIISERMAATGNVRPLARVNGEFFGLLGEPISVRFGLIDQLSIGGVVVHNVPVAIMADDSLRFFVVNKEQFNMDFLIGTNLLREFRTEIDFRRERVTFTPKSERAQPASNQNLFLIDFRPTVHTVINKRGWYLMTLDTGSEITFLNTKSVAYTRMRNAPRFHGALLQGLGGATKHGEKIEDVSIGIDRWAGKFKDIPLYDTDEARTMGIIGQNFMKNFRVVIDFGTMRVELHHDRILGSEPPPVSVAKPPADAVQTAAR